MALAVSGSDINPLAPSNQLHPRILFSSSQVTTMIVKKQEEANVKTDIAEDSASNKRPANLLSLRRSSSSIPSSVLPPLPEGVSEDTRRNFFLKTKDSKIEADVTIVPCSVPDSVDEKGKRKVVLHAKMSDGRVALKLYDASPPPYQLNRHHLRRTHPPQPPSFLPRAITPQSQGWQNPLLRGCPSADHHFIRSFIKCFLGEFVAEEWGENGEEVTA
ncbi:hypothetical protein K443DRAFT_459202 [Laccaria amethystina LaAM-08-1]|uniref:DUF7330 domain-containing protein n=1 Tax=Laccaria amethystina LaAM-08-1 TaxID=1095629 RepID=A0A0C9WNN4_9AGAR|nr:hypothetical protein K443DRAFT_459202 [Laccaria amethystina LaAM-08-1]